MIDPAFARTMARYDRWQNASLIAAATVLTDDERWKDRGAYFRSICATLNHILSDHRVWLARLTGDDATAQNVGARHPYTDSPRDWVDYRHQRSALDEEIATWANSLTDADIDRTVSWRRGDTPVQTEAGFLMVHMFNHATHHRGQVHGMLTAAGIDPGSTDMPMLPDEI